MVKPTGIVKTLETEKMAIYTYHMLVRRRRWNAQFTLHFMAVVDQPNNRVKEVVTMHWVLSITLLWSTRIRDAGIITGKLTRITASLSKD